MREIKFRAWNVEQKKWVIRNAGLMYPLVLKADEDKILVQYTGLKDKNGVEIYEGDILDGDSYVGQVVVEFGYHETSTDYYASGAYGFYGARKDGSDSTFEGGFFTTMGVIGNIHENPELVKE